MADLDAKLAAALGWTELDPPKVIGSVSLFWVSQDGKHWEELEFSTTGDGMLFVEDGMAERSWFVSYQRRVGALSWAKFTYAPPDPGEPSRETNWYQAPTAPLAVATAALAALEAK